MMRTVLALGVMGSVLATAPAGAKEISSAKLCGADDCRMVTDGHLAMVLSAGGPPTSGPEQARPWYRVTLTVRAEQGSGEVFVDRFSIAAVPSVRLLRGVDGTWMQMEPGAAAGYARVTAAIEPRPPRTLPGVGEDAHLPAARVDEVVEPPDVSRPAGKGSLAWLSKILGGLVAVGLLGLVVTLRR